MLERDMTKTATRFMSAQSGLLCVKFKGFVGFCFHYLIPRRDAKGENEENQKMLLDASSFFSSSSSVLNDDSMLSCVDFGVLMPVI